MGTPIKDVSGERFGRLMAYWPAGFAGKVEGGKRRIVWACGCDCGNVTAVAGDQLRSGHTRSCGCLTVEASRKRLTRHGHMSRQGSSPTYNSWKGMIGRCTYEAVSGYCYYGERGVTVCARWRDFTAFLADMGERPAGTTLDRIDSNGNYEPGNCRWATPKEQVASRRRSH
jgi:hypothetical protein